MRRDLGTLRRWAVALEHDARTSPDGTWRLVVDDSYVLAVSRDHLREQVLLSELVADWAPPHRATALDEDAAEALAYEFLEVRRLWDGNWTSCSEHDQPVFVCSALWVCAGPMTHEIAPVGGLPTRDRY